MASYPLCDCLRRQSHPRTLYAKSHRAAIRFSPPSFEGLMAEGPLEREPTPRACACLDRPEEHAEFTGRRREPHAPFEARPQCAPLPEAAALPEPKIYAPIHRKTHQSLGRPSRSVSICSRLPPRESSGGQASSVACRRMPSHSRVAPLSYGCRQARKPTG